VQLLRVFASRCARTDEPDEAVDIALSAEGLREMERALSGLRVNGGRMNEAQIRVVHQ
jgi:hypothetical protein